MQRQRDKSVSNAAVAVKKKKDDDQVEHHHLSILKLLGIKQRTGKIWKDEKVLIESVLNDWSNIKQSLEEELQFSKITGKYFFYDWEAPNHFPDTSELNMYHVICYFLALPDFGNAKLLEGFLNSDDICYKHPCGADDASRELYNSEDQFQQCKEVIEFCKRAYTMTGQKAFKSFLNFYLSVDI